MKKYFIATAVALLIVSGLSSCVNKNRCWRVEVVYTVEGQENVTEVTYAWGTAAEETTLGVVSSITSSIFGAKIVSNKAEEVSQYKTKEDCLNQNPN